jgi:hypothetical protein
LVILNHLDTIERVQGDVKQLKYSLIASDKDRWNYKKLFPEYDQEPKGEIRELAEGEEIPEGADIDLSQVEWKSPKDDPEGFEKLMAMVNRASKGFSGAEVVGSGEPVWSDWR